MARGRVLVAAAAVALRFAQAQVEENYTHAGTPSASSNSTSVGGRSSSTDSGEKVFLSVCLVGFMASNLLE